MGYSKRNQAVDLTIMTKVLSTIIIILTTIIFIHLNACEAKDFKPKPSTAYACIARFNSTTGEPLYYNCPRPNESEKKIYCCNLDKCCEYNEFIRQQERLYKARQIINTGLGSKGSFGINVLRGILICILLVILVFITLCCCCLFTFCKGKKLLSGAMFNQPLPNQPPPTFPGPSPYARPAQPYSAYQWPPETAPPPAYPPYPTNFNTQPPYNPNFK